MNALRPALSAATAFFMLLFTLGFALGTVRVVFVAPRLGDLLAVLAEVPIMLTAAYFACRWTVRHWRVDGTPMVRWSMVLWFLALLFAFETVVGSALFGRTSTEQWGALVSPAGLLGICAQVIAALLPLFVGRDQ